MKLYRPTYYFIGGPITSDIYTQRDDAILSRILLTRQVINGSGLDESIYWIISPGRFAVSFTQSYCNCNTSSPCSVVLCAVSVLSMIGSGRTVCKSPSTVELSLS
jgi:hypothetical protein